MDVSVEINELFVDGPEDLTIHGRLMGMLDTSTAHAVAAAVSEALSNAGADRRCAPGTWQAAHDIFTK